MDFDRNLVELLPQYPIIWDRSRKDFRNNNKKENAFKALARELKAPVEQVMARYKAVREKYRKEKLKMRMMTSTGGTADSWDTWELFHNLTFLDGVMLSRKRPSNNGLSVSQIQSQVTTPKWSQISANTSAESKSQDMYTESILIQEIVESDSEDLLREESPLPYCEKVLTHSSTPTASDSSGLQNTKRRKKENLNSDLKAMVTTLQDVAASLKVDNEYTKATKYDWLGKYIAATLNEMEATAAASTADEILAAMLKRKK